MSELLMKHCSGCGESQPRDSFGKWARGKDGLQPWCKQCQRTHARLWAKANPAKVAATKAMYRATHPARVQAARRTYRAAHGSQLRATSATWRAENPARIEEYNAAYYAAYREEERARVADYRSANPAKVRMAVAAYRARQLNAPGGGISPEQWQRTLIDSLGICAYCNRTVRLSLDHIEPLALGGAHDIANAAAACGRCNRSKANHSLIVWLARQRSATTSSSQSPRVS